MHNDFDDVPDFAPPRRKAPKQLKGATHVAMGQGEYINFTPHDGPLTTLMRDAPEILHVGLAGVGFTMDREQARFLADQIKHWLKTGELKKDACERVVASGRGE